MGPPKAVGTISQRAFDEMVKENITDLGMEPDEGLQDAIQTLSLQGVDLSGIVARVPGEDSAEDHPVIQLLERLKQLSSDCLDRIEDDKASEEAVLLLQQLNNLSEGSENPAIATKNGGIELMCSMCSRLRGKSDQGVLFALNSMASFLGDIQSSELFRGSDGPKIVVGILNDGLQNIEILKSAFSIVAAASSNNEVIKESFMELRIDKLMVKCLTKHNKGSIPTLYDALRALLTADDNRVVASQVYGYARQFAKVGIVEALVDLLHEGLCSIALVSAIAALKVVVVNDEICRSVTEKGGIDAILNCIDDSGEQGNRAVAKACCSLLSKLAGSDANKRVVVEKGGLERLIKLSTRYFDDPSILQEIMSIICVLSLRSPDNAALAVEAGAGDLAIQAMQKFPEAKQMQRTSCLMTRNLVVRNPENRTLLLGNGIEKYIRKAKENHMVCKNAARDALRDLGLEDYNL